MISKLVCAAFVCLIAQSQMSAFAQQYVLCVAPDNSQKAIFYIKPVTGARALSSGENDVSFSFLFLAVPSNFRPTMRDLESDLKRASRDDTHYWGKLNNWEGKYRERSWQIDRQSGVLTIENTPNVYLDGPANKYRNIDDPSEKALYNCGAINRDQASTVLQTFNNENSTYRSTLKSKNKF